MSTETGGGTLLADAFALGAAWRQAMPMASALRSVVAPLARGGEVDLIAIGKAAPEMAAIAEEALGSAVARRLIVTDEAGAAERPGDGAVLVGRHPRPSAASVSAARTLVALLRSSRASATVFLVSGGVSSLCAWPESPLTVADLGALFDAASATGADITTLNRLRAATSMISGGRVLDHVRTPRVVAAVMVDNVISGAPWVASGLTYRHAIDEAEVRELIARVGLEATALGERLAAAAARRREAFQASGRTCDNEVVARPDDVRAATLSAARARGYRPIDLGSAVRGDAGDLARLIRVTLDATGGGRRCVLGVGESTARVPAGGRGGRCQHLALSLAPLLGRREGPATFLGVATDGRDFLADVGGAWVDERSDARLRALGRDLAADLAAGQSADALRALGQLRPGGRTGWNLCDLYVAVAEDP